MYNYDRRKANVHVMFPAKYLESAAGEYDDQTFWKNLDPRSSRAREWAKTIHLTSPIEVWVGTDGRVTFDDGHHRAMAGKILDRMVPVIIKRNRLKPEVWEWFYNRIMRGEGPRDINPGYNEDIQTLYNESLLT